MLVDGGAAIWIAGVALFVIFALAGRRTLFATHRGAVPRRARPAHCRRIERACPRRASLHHLQLFFCRSDGSPESRSAVAWTSVRRRNHRHFFSRFAWRRSSPGACAGENVCRD